MSWLTVTLLAQFRRLTALAATVLIGVVILNDDLTGNVGVPLATVFAIDITGSDWSDAGCTGGEHIHPPLSAPRAANRFIAAANRGR